MVGGALGSFFRVGAQAVDLDGERDMLMVPWKIHQRTCFSPERLRCGDCRSRGSEAGFVFNILPPLVKVTGHSIYCCFHYLRTQGKSTKSQIRNIVP